MAATVDPCRSDIDDLTLYDLHRKPRQQVEGQVLERPLHMINAELTCPVCLGTMRNTMIVMECLHRFCGECIQKSLRIGRKECPSCRIHVPSRRSLRQDTNFDAIIQKIHPNLAKELQSEEKRIAQHNRERNLNNAFAQSCQEGIMMQQQQRKRSVKHKRKRGAGSDDGVEAKKIELMHRLVNLALRRHPAERDLGDLERPYLRLSSEFKVRQLKKFLSAKLGKQNVAFDLVVVAGSKCVVLEDHSSLHDVCQHFWDGQTDLIIHYRVGVTV